MKPLTIIGGGLAGLTLGIALRQRAVPVTILEAGRYPRHRVCGEFISGHGLNALERLGLLHLLERTGARGASTAAFFTTSRCSGAQTLPRAALCLSRHRLDAALAQFFVELGGELLTGTRAKPDFTEGVIGATGRRARAIDRGWRWIGLKAHARNVQLTADLEMHLARDSYVGLCRLAEGTVNVCGLFRRRAQAQGAEVIRELRGEPGSLLSARLERAEFLPESVCAIAALSLLREPVDAGVCRVGDALMMIPPITGNGMSMAFEAAELASDPLIEYARGETQWFETTGVIAARLRQRFARRLWWAGALHRILFHGGCREAFLPLFLRSTALWRAVFEVTRTAPGPAVGVGRVCT